MRSTARQAVQQIHASSLGCTVARARTTAIFTPVRRHAQRHQGLCGCRLHGGGCRHDHRMKGSTAWRLRQPRPGTLIWTAPSGLSRTAEPEPHVA
jgi:hypothetical protein